MTRITAPACPPVDRASASTASEQAHKAKPPKAPNDREGFRQAMSWLHTWAGLILGWLLFAIFLTGTLSFFKNEFNLWMRPEMHGLQPVDAADPQMAQTAQKALDALVRKVPNVTQWIMHLPDDRDPAVNILWRDTGNGRFETLRMHPQTGEAIDTRQTMGDERKNPVILGSFAEGRGIERRQHGNVDRLASHEPGQHVVQSRRHLHPVNPRFILIEHCPAVPKV